MSQLSFAKKALKLTLLLLCLSYSSFASSLDSIPKEEFDKICKKSDAYYVQYYRDVRYQKSWSGSYEKTTMISSKMVINTSEGVEENAFLKLSEYVSNHIGIIDVKTIKSDGSTVELDSSLVFKRNEEKKFDAVEYPIPGVEVGDTIVMNISYNRFLKKHKLSDFVDLNTSIPSMNTEYTVRTDSDLTMKYKTYNGFPKPQFIINDTMMYAVFKEERKKAIPENQYGCYACDLPYVYFTLDKPDKELRTWKDVYNEEFNAITQPILLDYENSSYYKRWRRRVLDDHDDLSKQEQLNVLIEEVNNTMEMEPAIAEEFIKSNGFFLKEKRLNPHIIRRLYRQILEDLEIEYWAVFARTKRKGPIDPYFIRKGDYDHIFFAYENDKGTIDFLYPNDEDYKYQINEIPTEIYNTQAVVVRPKGVGKRSRSDKYINYDMKMAKVDSVEVNLLTLPKMNTKYNYLKQIFYCQIDPETRITKFKHRFSVSGGLSTDLRKFYSMLAQNEDAGNYFDALTEFEGEENLYEVDSVINVHLNNEKPFSYTINSMGRMEKGIKFISDSIISVSLKDLIQHTQVENENNKGELDAYLDYSYTDLYMYIMIFPQDIEILGFDENKMDYENDYAKYQFDIKLVGSKQISIKSNYVINKDLIPKEDIESMDEVNDGLRDLKNKRLLIKIKSS